MRLQGGAGPGRPGRGRVCCHPLGLLRICCRPSFDSRLKRFCDTPRRAISLVRLFLSFILRRASPGCGLQPLRSVREYFFPATERDREIRSGYILFDAGSLSTSPPQLLSSSQHNLLYRNPRAHPPTLRHHVGASEAAAAAVAQDLCRSRGGIAPVLALTLDHAAGG